MAHFCKLCNGRKEVRVKVGETFELKPCGCVLRKQHSQREREKSANIFLSLLSGRRKKDEVEVAPKTAVETA